MNQVKLSIIESAIVSAIGPDAQTRTSIAVAPMPIPYIPPTFRVNDGDLNSEIIFVKAPAAVGKSVTAKYLSSKRNAPLLDLADVAVGTGSLQGLLTEYCSDGVAKFHRGELPIVVDALDEGRILSGENSLEAFLASAMNFLQSNRSTTDRPKLVFFGREESTELSKLAVEISGEDIVCW